MNLVRSSDYKKLVYCINSRNYGKIEEFILNYLNDTSINKIEISQSKATVTYLNNKIYTHKLNDVNKKSILSLINKLLILKESNHSGALYFTNVTFGEFPVVIKGLPKFTFDVVIDRVVEVKNILNISIENIYFYLYFEMKKKNNLTNIEVFDSISKLSTKEMLDVISSNVLYQLSKFSKYFNTNNHYLDDGRLVLSFENSFSNYPFYLELEYVIDVFHTNSVEIKYISNELRVYNNNLKNIYLHDSNEMVSELNSVITVDSNLNTIIRNVRNVYNSVHSRLN